MCKSGRIWTEPHPVWTDGPLRGFFTERKNWKRIRGSNVCKSKESCYCPSLEHIQSVPGVKVTTLGFNSRADSESKRHTHMSPIHNYRDLQVFKVQ